jgi:hypothetical protein
LTPRVGTASGGCKLTGKSPINKFAPNPIFKDYIQCYWTLIGPGNDHLAEVHDMPLDGGVELIFNLSASVECTVDNSSPMTIDKENE